MNQSDNLPGERGLPPEVPRASLAVLRRMAHEVSSVPYIPPTDDEVTAWSDLLREHLPTLSESLRIWLDSTPAVEEVWEWHWQGHSQGERDTLRHAWQQQLQAFSAAHPALGEIAATVSAPTLRVPPRPSHRRGPAGSAIADLNMSDREMVEAAARLDPRLAERVRTQLDAKNVQLATQMAGIIHEMHSAINRNITYS